eukprot:scaffold49788_cov64-Cyclotella_meneghiniana.AAC.2
MEKFQRDEPGEDEDDGGDDAGALHWDKFEFGDRYVYSMPAYPIVSFPLTKSPKMDKRFANDSTSSEQVGIPDEVLNNIPADSVTYQSYFASKATMDQKTSKRFKDSQ